VLEYPDNKGSYPNSSIFEKESNYVGMHKKAYICLVMKELCVNLIKARRKVLISQSQLANKLNIDQSTYSRIEQGVSPITVIQLIECSRILKTPVNELMNLKDVGSIETIKKQTEQIQNLEEELSKTKIGLYAYEEKMNKIHERAAASVIRFQKMLPNEMFDEGSVIEKISSNDEGGKKDISVSDFLGLIIEAFYMELLEDKVQFELVKKIINIDLIGEGIRDLVESGDLDDPLVKKVFISKDIDLNQAEKIITSENLTKAIMDVSFSQILKIKEKMNKGSSS
jgi:transcriptional regulator with XRE-family HTH domain